MIILDLDDFCDEYQSVDLLEELKLKIPQFKVTLFAIPARTSRPVFDVMLGQDWIDLVPHGWKHETNHECEDWVYRQITDCLKRCEDKGFRTKGFKAPGWNISEGCYYGLRDMGYWVADHPRNKPPVEIPRYLVGPNSIHGHVVGPSDNALENLMTKILKHKDEEFGFVADAVRHCNPTLR